MNLSRSTKVAAAGLALGASLFSFSSTTQALELTQEQKRAIAAVLTAPKGAPGSGIDNPVAFGASLGDVYFSIGGVKLPDSSSSEEDYDGSASIGVGFGDSSKVVGIEVELNLISLKDNGVDSDAGDDSNMSVKIHRQISDSSSFAVGWEGLAGRGAARDKDISHYAAYSGFTALGKDPMNPLILSYTVGIGDGRFNNEEKHGTAAFGSISLQVHRQVSIILDANKESNNVGLSFVPIASLPLTISLSAFDVNENNGDVTYGGSLGYSHRF